MALRESLPFEVAQIFLIHRESGLLLWHVSADPRASPDSDLISGMLTAIRDFVQDAFGRGEQDQLEEIQYGERRILIEAARHAYLAVVVDGIEPPGFRAQMRERIIEVEYTHEKTLSHYEGNPTALAPVEEPLRSLMMATEARGLSSTTPTAVPTSTTTPISTATPTPMPTSTPAPVMGVMTGHVWLRAEPFDDSPRLGVILERGQQVEILAVFGDWYQVRWVPQAQAEAIGWVPAKWVGTTMPIPSWIVTPTIGP